MHKRALTRDVARAVRFNDLRVVKRFLALLSLAALTARPAAAQAPRRANPLLEWPAPTRESRPWTRWWWLGSAVDSASLTTQIAELDSAGFGGVEVTVLYGAKGAESAYLPYLSTPWVGVIQHVATQTKARGMGLDLPQGSGWRIGGPGVPLADQNTSMDIRLDSASGEYVAKLRFSGDNVKRAAPGGEGPALDPFSAVATANYLAMFRERTASFPRGMIRSYFHDSFEYTGDASPALFDAFEKKRGYDLTKELAALTGHGDADHVARVKSDYRETMSDMLLENFVTQLTKWSHDRGALMREQAHGSPGNLLDLYAAADIPETEIYGPPTGADGDPLINKFASSAAHVGGHQLASAESFTWLGEHFTSTLDEIKQAADKMFLAGINHFVYHGTAYSPAGAAWPGWQFYASTEFNPRNAIWHDLPAFNRYVTRVQGILQGGKPENDVLLYWPVSDNWHDAAGRRMDFRVHDPQWYHGKPFGRDARNLHGAGFGVDYVSDRQLAHDVVAKGHALVAHDARYTALIIPATVHMPLPTMARILALAKSGATVIFAGPLPVDVPGAMHVDERRRDLTAMTTPVTWTVVSANVRSATLGAGKLWLGNDPETLLDAAGIERDPLAREPGLRTIRRLTTVGHDYFIASSAPVTRWVRLRAEMVSAVVMDPMSGRTGLARTRMSGGHREMLVQMDSGESRIIRQSRVASSGAEWPYASGSGTPVEIRGTWKVSFREGGPVLPPSFTADAPGPWTGRGNADADRFAGTARYTISFDAPDNADRHELRLGHVAESARVRLNGRDLGTSITAPFRLETGALEPRGNVLEIDVTNVSANRVRDLDLRHVDWKIFRDINFVDFSYKPFDASKWPVRTSGLSGPVTLRALQPLP